MSDRAAFVVEAVARALPGWGRPGSVVPGSVRLERRLWSYLVWFLWEEGGRAGSMVIKIPHWEGVESLEDAVSRGPQPSTQEEFAMLVAVADAVAASGDPDVTAIGAVGYLPQMNAIVADGLDAVPLRVLATGRRRERRLQLGQVLTATGRLLRVVHDVAGDAGDEPFESDGYLAEFRRIDARMASLGARPNGWDSLVERAAGDAVRLGGRPARSARIHGDLTAANVLVTPDGRVAVLDPNPRRALVAEDPAKLLVELATGRDYLMHTARPGGSRVLGERAAAFAAGYGPLADEQWELASRIALMRRWIDAEERWLGAAPLTRGGLALRMVRRVARRWVSWTPARGGDA